MPIIFWFWDAWSDFFFNNADWHLIIKFSMVLNSWAGSKKMVHKNNS